MVSARKHISEKYPYILDIRCIAHFVNLITKDILEYDFASKIVKKCNIISRFFKMSHRAGAILDKYMKEYNVEGGGLRIYTPTRWTSMFETTDAVYRLRRPLEKIYDDHRDIITSESTKQFLDLVVSFMMFYL